MYICIYVTSLRFLIQVIGYIVAASQCSLLRLIMNKSRVPDVLKRNRDCWDEWPPPKSRPWTRPAVPNSLRKKVNVSSRRKWRAKAGREHFFRLSKKLSKVLRHTAVEEGFDMHKDGCIAVHDLLAHLSFKAFTEEDILVCIENNAKDRFELIVEGNTSWVRARQGHNQEVAERIDEDSLHTRITLDTAPRIAIHGTFSTLLEKIAEKD
jgi:RNA:NAD 2'-phosphotransferase (TPT1/KptA family)